MRNNLYRTAIHIRVSRTTLPDAKENRDRRTYAAFAQGLIRIARDLYDDEGFGIELYETDYALDASTIDLCLTLFPWVRF